MHMKVHIYWVTVHHMNKNSTNMGIDGSNWLLRIEDLGYALFLK